MNAWYKKNPGIVWIIVVMATLVSFAFKTFATVDYVDKRHNDVVGTLSEIKMELRDTREKVYNLNGEIAPKLNPRKGE